MRFAARLLTVTHTLRKQNRHVLTHLSNACRAATEPTMKRFRVHLMGGGVALLLVLLFFSRGERVNSATGALPAGQGRIERVRRVARAFEEIERRRIERIARATPKAAALDEELALRRLLEEPTNVKAALRAGETKWMTTVLEVEDLFFARDERLECGRALGAEISQGCSYDVRMAVERTGPQQGIVRFVKSRVGGKQPEPVCEAYADCVAFARLGKTVPLPDEAQTRYGLEQSLESTPLDPEMNDPAYVERLVGEHRLGLEEFKANMNPDSPADRYQAQWHGRFIEYLEQHLKELKGGADRAL